MSPDQISPIRVLHVVGAMNAGGVETWLMHVLRNLDRERIQMDFLVHTHTESLFDDEILSLGGKILHCSSPSNLFAYIRDFRRLAKEYGPYDVIHSHVHHFSGVTLSLARTLGVPLRIAHSHSDTRSVQASSRIVRRAYFAVMKQLIAMSSNCQLAGSNHAAQALFRVDSGRSGHYQVLHYGIDFAPFAILQGDDRLKNLLGVPEDAWVIGHVGRFVPEKNHRFILDILEKLMRYDSRVYGLLVGDGPLRWSIEESARERGIADRVLFTGVRTDIPDLMTQVMNVFILPSLYEGLPLTGVEAQAAGLPCYFSDSITEEVVIPNARTKFLSIEDAGEWAAHIRDTLWEPVPNDREHALQAALNSAFNVFHSIKELQHVYENAGQRINPHGPL